MTKYPTTIKNLIPSLPERGKIKIGIKGELRKGKSAEYRLPQKLDYFRIVTIERNPDDNDNFIIDQEIHDIYGEKPTEIKVRLLYDDIALNLLCNYKCYSGRKVYCVGDGEVATLSDGKQVKCPCERIEAEYDKADKCKINGCLSVLIDGAEKVGGVWKFRTGSFNSVAALSGSLLFIKSITNGLLAGIPLTLCLSPKSVTNPKTQSPQTIYFVSAEYRGKVEELRKLGYKIALDRKTYEVRMEDIEAEARKTIEYDPEFMDKDTGVEFYPEDVIETEGADVVEPEGPSLKDLHDELMSIIFCAEHKVKNEDIAAYMEFCQGSLNKSAREDDHLSIEQTYSRAIDGINGGGLEKFLVGFGKKYEIKSGEPTDAEKEAILEQELAEAEEGRIK